MSLKKIIQALGEAFNAVKNFIEKILPSSKHLLDVALVVVNNIKVFTDSGAADVIVQLIPGTADDTALAKIRQVLPQIMVWLKLADDEASKTADEIVKDGINAIQNMPEDAKSVTLQGVWQLLSNHLTDDGVNLPSLQKIGQVYYEQSKVA